MHTFVPTDPRQITEALGDAGIDGITAGITALHGVYHAIDIADGDQPMREGIAIPADVCRAASEGAFDRALVKLVGHPNDGISFEAGHDLWHSPTGIESLRAELALGAAELEEIRAAAIATRKERGRGQHPSVIDVDVAEALRERLAARRPVAAVFAEQILPRHEEEPASAVSVAGEIAAAALTGAAGDPRFASPDLVLFALSLGGTVSEMARVSLTVLTTESVRVLRAHMGLLESADSPELRAGLRIDSRLVGREPDVYRSIVAALPELLARCVPESPDAARLVRGVWAEIFPE